MRWNNLQVNKKKSILFDWNSSWRPELPHFSSNTLACVTCSAETTTNIMLGWPAGSLKLKMSGFSLRIPLFPSAVLKPSIQDHWRFVMNNFLGVCTTRCESELLFSRKKYLQFVYFTAVVGQIVQAKKILVKKIWYKFFFFFFSFSE